MDASNPIAAPCRFIEPCDEWMAQFVGLEKQHHPWIPSDWAVGLNLIDVPTGVNATAECKALEVLMAERTLARRAEITSQAWGGTDAVAPVWALLGDPMSPYKPASIKLRDLVLDCVTGPLFTLKKGVDRGRPGCCCTAVDLDPMFASGPLHPGHPSYPSGHAAQAHAMAFVLRLMKPQSPLDFEGAASDVAENREVAGLHFASDSEAGRQLAARLVFLLNKRAGFKRMVTDAANEWLP